MTDPILVLVSSSPTDITKALARSSNPTSPFFTGMDKHTVINFPALGETPVTVDRYVPNTINLQDGTTHPYGVMVNGTVFVSPHTFAQLETGNLDLIVLDLGTLEPSSSILPLASTQPTPRSPATSTSPSP